MVTVTGKGGSAHASAGVGHNAHSIHPGMSPYAHHHATKAQQAEAVRQMQRRASLHASRPANPHPVQVYLDHTSTITSRR